MSEDEKKNIAIKEKIYNNALEDASFYINRLINMDTNTLEEIFCGIKTVNGVLNVFNMNAIINMIVDYDERKKKEESNKDNIFTIGDEICLIKNPNYKTVVIFIDSFGNIKCLNKNFEYMIINPDQYHNWERTGNRVPYIIEAVKAIVNGEYMEFKDNESANY